MVVSLAKLGHLRTTDMRSLFQTHLSQLLGGALLILGVWGCQAQSPVPPKPKASAPAAVARVIAPTGWERDVLSAILPQLDATDAALVQRRFDVTGVIEVAWTPAVEASLAAVHDDLVTEWVRPNRTRFVRPNQGKNRNAADTSNINAIVPGGDTGFDLTGAGVTLGEWDEGVPRTSHQELIGRVRVVDGAGPVAHSTEVGGTMIATGISAAARGMATEARLLAHDWDLDTLELHGAAPLVGATNHSYGAILGWDFNDACGDKPSWLGGTGSEDRAFGKYMADASALDAVTHARDVLVVWAAGNERQDSGGASGSVHYHWPDCSRTYSDRHVSEVDTRFDTLGGQPTFKNGLTVGAVGDVIADPIPRASIVAEDYSSFGPMDDGRIKPDIAASGDTLYTTNVLADDAYATVSGTSLATPVVAGALALLAQKYRQVNEGRDPRAAELKALVLQTAREGGSAAGPDYQLGFGLLDASAAATLLDAEKERSLASRQLQVGVIHEDETLTHRSAVVAAGTALRVTAAWLDPAGAPNTGDIDDPTHALINDVDVVLVAPDQQTLFHPWRLRASSPSAAATRTGTNEVDNVEMIDVDAKDNVWTGKWSARVTVNGVLQPRGRAQAYALVSSVPLTTSTGPVLGAPRTVVIETAFGSTSATATVPLTNLGSGTLSWSLTESMEWLSTSATTGTAPDGFDVNVDVGSFDAPGEYTGLIEIDSSDGSGVRVIGVVVRLTCAADCDGRQCGVDPVCGQLCGRCASGRACTANGTCATLMAGCPAVNLGSQLGVVAQGSTTARIDASSGSCGGSGGRDAAFHWTAPEAGFYEFTTLGADFDTVMYLLDNDCSGDELACNDDSGGVTSTVSANLAAGQQVVVVVDGYDGSGAYVLTASRASCPSADIGSALGGLVLETSNLGAVNSLEGSCGGDKGEDVVVRWTAPADGRFHFTTEGSDDDTDTVLYALADTCNGQELACADTRNTRVHGADELTLDLSRDQVVVVVIDGAAESDLGRVKLTITTEAESCEGACGGTPNGACFCDSACVAAGDCCADACTLCGHCDCTASCVGVACGDDGCGGTCGECDAGEVCDAGECVVDPCAGVTCAQCEACNDGSCAPLPEFAACDDEVRCTVSDQCVAGVCVGSAIVCNDSDPCTADACDETLGLCAFDRMAGCCDEAADCSDGDLCTFDRCDVPNRQCRFDERADCCRAASECDDGQPCTDDACLRGVCIHTEADACSGDGGLDDAGLNDGGWRDAQVHGGGCSCRVHAGAAESSDTRGWMGLVFVLFAAALVMRRRTFRARSRAGVAAPQSRRLR